MIEIWQFTISMDHFQTIARLYLSHYQRVDFQIRYVFQTVFIKFLSVSALRLPQALVSHGSAQLPWSRGTEHRWWRRGSCISSAIFAMGKWLHDGALSFATEPWESVFLFGFNREIIPKLSQIYGRKVKVSKILLFTQNCNLWWLENGWERKVSERFTEMMNHDWTVSLKIV